jgi:hypothetical protein
LRRPAILLAAAFSLVFATAAASTIYSIAKSWR